MSQTVHLQHMQICYLIGNPMCRDYTIHAKLFASVMMGYGAQTVVQTLCIPCNAAVSSSLALKVTLKRRVGTQDLCCC